MFSHTNRRLLLTTTDSLISLGEVDTALVGLNIEGIPPPLNRTSTGLRALGPEVRDSNLEISYCKGS